MEKSVYIVAATLGRDVRPKEKARGFVREIQDGCSMMQGRDSNNARGGN